jgi:CRP/FNR family nitrogen fixation transcriptional regulator
MHMGALPKRLSDALASAAQTRPIVVGQGCMPQGLADGQVLYVEGERAKQGYRVLDGVVRLSTLMPDGRRCVLEFLLPGDIFGFEADEVHGTSAEAAGPATVLPVPPIAPGDAATEGALRRATAARLARAHTRMVRLACMSATERTASLLLEMADRLGRGGEVVLPMSRADLADYLGLRAETLCRVLARLRQGGAIALPAANRILLRDRAALEEAAMQGRRAGTSLAPLPANQP